MKVRNRTDAPSDKLKAYGMENHTIAVADFVFEPGKEVEIPAGQETHVRALLEHFVGIEAVAISHGESETVETSTTEPPKKSEDLSAKQRVTARPPRRPTEG